MTIDLKALAKNFETVIEEFQKAANIVDEFIDPIVQGTERGELNVHLMLYAYMDHCKDVCDALSKMCNKNMPIVAERAERLMTQECIDGMKFMGKDWSVGTKEYAQVSGVNQAACVAWLKGHPLGKSLVSEGYHPASLQKFVKECILEKGEKPPEFVSVFSKKVLVARKARS